MKLTVNSRIRLNNGIEMPILGLGTWQLRTGKQAENAVLWALEAGYRRIDTAAIYGNEESVGKAVRKSGIPREDIFITTKLWNADHDNPEKALDVSLKRLGTDYADLYLIHWPVEGKRLHAWEVLEKLHGEGRCRAIGVSNFTIKHLEELPAHTETLPAVNQVEFNPYLFQKELMEYCFSKGIQLEAYCPLTRGEKLKDPGLASIALKYRKTPAQILIRWSLQHNLAVIPKSAKRERIMENSQVFGFSISEVDMRRLDGFNESYRVCWDPDDIP